MLVVAALLWFVLVVPPSWAGTYEHHAVPLDGWAPEVYAPAGFVSAGSEAGALWLRFWARPWFAPGERAEWAYTAPPDTTIVGWTAERRVSGVTAGDWNTLFGAIVDGRWHHVAWDVPSLERAWGPVGGAGFSASQVIARLACGGPHVCQGTAALELRDARFVLADAHAPVVSRVQGDLAGEPVLRGGAALSFAASDRGGGLYRAWAEIDGRPGPPVALGDERCRAIAGRFAHRRPCPLEAGATVEVDTTAVADGRHVFAVRVEDAAGNRTTVFGPATKTVSNAAPAATPPAPPSAPRVESVPPAISAWLEHRGRRRSAVTVSHGVRVRIRGRAPAAAVIEGDERAIDGFGRPVGQWRAATAVRARADGRFTTFTRVGPSRRIRIEGGPLLTLRVRAPVTLRRAGARLRGRAPARALVELQQRARGRWVTRLVVRAYRSGRFSARLDGRVRARVPRQAGLPYAAGLARPISSRTGRRTGRRTSR